MKCLLLFHNCYVIHLLNLSEILTFQNMKWYNCTSYLPGYHSVTYCHFLYQVLWSFTSWGQVTIWDKKPLQCSGCDNTLQLASELSCLVFHELYFQLLDLFDSGCTKSFFSHIGGIPKLKMGWRGWVCLIRRGHLYR